MGTLRAVVFDLRLLPTRPVKDFHLLSSAHARHTYALNRCDLSIIAGAMYLIIVFGILFLLWIEP